MDGSIFFGTFMTGGAKFEVAGDIMPAFSKLLNSF